MIDPLPIEIIDQFSTAIDFAEKYDAHGIELSRERYKLYKEHQLHIDTLQPGEFLHSL